MYTYIFKRTEALRVLDRAQVCWEPHCVHHEALVTLQKGERLVHQFANTTTFASEEDETRRQVCRQADCIHHETLVALQRDKRVLRFNMFFSKR